MIIMLCVTVKDRIYIFKGFRLFSLPSAISAHKRCCLSAVKEYFNIRCMKLYTVKIKALFACKFYLLALIQINSLVFNLGLSGLDYFMEKLYFTIKTVTLLQF